MNAPSVPWALLGLALAFTSCAVRFPTPYPAEALAVEMDAPGRALVHYLGQAEADVEVCSLGREGPHAPLVDEAVLDLLHGALVEGAVAPDVWRGCVGRLWPGLEEEPQQALALTLLLDLFHYTRTGALDDGEVEVPMVVAMLDVLLGRPEGLLLPADQVRSISEELRGAIRAERLGARTVSLVIRLLRAIELDAGLWRGELVDETLVSGLSDEEALHAMARRLPDATLLELARERLVRVRIARLGEPDLAPLTDEIVAGVMRDGHWEPPAERFGVLAARWRASDDLPSVLRVIQDPLHSTAALRAVHADRRAPPDSALRLREGVEITVNGLQQPIGLCPGVDRWDPTPCVESGRLGFTHALATLDGTTVRFTQELAIDDLVALARDGDELPLQPTVGSTPVEGLVLSLHFDPVPDLILTNPGAGARGPDLRVDVFEVSHGRLLFGVERLESEERYAALVARHDADFMVTSSGTQGTQGQTGSAGAAGSNGTSGMAATCYSMGGMGQPGGNGQPGGTGGVGGAGGSGGDIDLRIHCDRCETVRALATDRVSSIGGPGGSGGPGGPGGQGGQGGQGGASASCTEYDSVSGTYKTRYQSGGSPGSQGSPGATGSQGSSGSPGSPGSVSMRLNP